MTRPFAESCEENKEPILEVLQQEWGDVSTVLEIGSGTGQHAVFFSQQIPRLHWQCSDRAENLPGIRQWLAELDEGQRLEPLQLDVANASDWPTTSYDAIFSANAVHIMGWPEVEAMFAGLAGVVRPGTKLCLYGPFNYGGDFTSESNARFDVWLKERDPRSGIRDFEAMNQLAQSIGMKLQADYAMPANNRILVWVKE